MPRDELIEERARMLLDAIKGWDCARSEQVALRDALASPPAADFPGGAPGPWSEDPSGDVGDILDRDKRLVLCAPGHFSARGRMGLRDFILRKVNAPAAPVVLSEEERAVVDAAMVWFGDYEREELTTVCQRELWDALNVLATRAVAKEKR